MARQGPSGVGDHSPTPLESAIEHGRSRTTAPILRAPHAGPATCRMAAGDGPPDRRARAGIDRRRRRHTVRTWARTTVQITPTVRSRRAAADRQAARLRLVERCGRGQGLRDQVAAALSSAPSYSGFEGLHGAEQRSLPRRVLAVTPTSRSTATPRSSRRSASGCSTSCRPGPAPSSRCDRRPRGLTGPGYDGHTFWDTEGVRAAGAYLHGSRSAAADVAPLAALDARPGQASTGHPPSGSRARLVPVADDPRATSAPSYWPAGTAAFHINADIADAVDPLPRNVTGDDSEFEPLDRRLEILVEIGADVDAHSATTTPRGKCVARQTG